MSKNTAKKESREIYRMAVLSTGHMQRSTDKLLSRLWSKSNCVTAKTPYGYILSKTVLKDLHKELGVVEFADVIKWMNKNRATYVYFDRDGPHMEDLAAFDW